MDGKVKNIAYYIVSMVELITFCGMSIFVKSMVVVIIFMIFSMPSIEAGQELSWLNPAHLIMFVSGFCTILGFICCLANVLITHPLMWIYSKIYKEDFIGKWDDWCVEEISM